MKFVIDSSVFVTAFVESELGSSLSLQFLRDAIERKDEFIVPLTVLVEAVVAVSRRANEELARELESFIFNLPNIQFVEMDITAARESIDIGTKLELRGMDAIVVSAAAVFEGELVTLDQEMIEKSRNFVEVHVLNPQEK